MFLRACFCFFIRFSFIIKSIEILLMTIQEAKQIRIADYLQSLGYTPIKQQGNSLWYKSPLRVEAEASFKVNTELNNDTSSVSARVQHHRIGFGTPPFRQCAVSVGVHSQTDTESAHHYPYAILFWSAIRFRTDVPTPANYGVVISCAAVLFARAWDRHGTRQEGM